MVVEYTGRVEQKLRSALFFFIFTLCSRDIYG